MKPILTMLPDQPSAEEIVKLIEKLTGRKATEKEMEEVRRILAKPYRSTSTRSAAPRAARTAGLSQKSTA